METKQSRPHEIAAWWWRSLQGDPAKAIPADRAALAQLRRCGTVAEAMQHPSAIDLFRRCGFDKPALLPRAGLAAAVLSHLREDAPGQHAARQLGPTGPEAPETARMSPLRFRRLMEAATPDERLTAFRRALALAGGGLNLRSLAEALLVWNDTTRQRWTYEYWNAGNIDATQKEQGE